MRRIIFLLLLISGYAQAQTFPDSTKQTGGISFTPQFNYKGISASTSAIQLYNSAINKYFGIYSAYQSDQRYAPIAGGGYVPTSRTLTINGTTYDLSVNRTWSIPPTGSAGGDLTGTYPNPTVNTINGITKSYYDFTSSGQSQLNGKANLVGGNTFGGTQIITDGTYGMQLGYINASGVGTIHPYGVTPTINNAALKLSSTSTKLQGVNSAGIDISGSNKVNVTNSTTTIQNELSLQTLNTGVTSDDILVSNAGTVKKIAGSSYVPYTGAMGDADMGAYKWSAGRFIATNTNDSGSPDAAFLINRTLSSGASNAHGFRDNTIFNRATLSYAAFDTPVSTSGTTDINAITGFQARQNIVNSGITNQSNGVQTLMNFSTGHLIQMNSFISNDIQTSGTIDVRTGFWMNDMRGAGTITKQIGLKIDNMSRGTTNVSIQTGNAPSWFNSTADDGSGAIVQINGGVSAANTLIKGTLGAGFLEIPFQSAPTTAPAAGYTRIKTTSNGNLSVLLPNGFVASFGTHTNTASRAYIFPDANGTVALTSDLPTYTSNVIYKGNGTTTPVVSSLTDDGTDITTTERLSVNGQPLRVTTNTAGFSTAIAGVVIQADGVDATTPINVLNAYGGTPTILTRRAGGTQASKTAVVSGNIIGIFSSRGYGSTDYLGTTGSLRFTAAETFNNTNAGGTYASIIVTPIGSVTGVEKLRVNTTGSVSVGGVGVTTGATALEANGSIGSTTLTASQLVATDANKVLVSVTALPSGTTAVTGSTGTGGTNVATQAYVDSGDALKLSNPMTTTGDIIYSSSGSTASRLGIGSTGNVLTVSGGLPTWVNPNTANDARYGRLSANNTWAGNDTWNGANTFGGISNTFTNGLTTFGDIGYRGTSTGLNYIHSANASATDYTATLPNASGTIDLGVKLRLTGSGTGAATTISIPHGLTGVTSSSIAIAQPINSASAGVSYVTTDATNINIVYTVAPILGTNNLSYNISIKP